MTRGHMNEEFKSNDVNMDVAILSKTVLRRNFLPESLSENNYSWGLPEIKVIKIWLEVTEIQS